MPNAEKHRSGITEYGAFIPMHTSLEWEDFRWLPHIVYRQSYTKPKRIVTPNAMTLEMREISIPAAIILCRLRWRSIAMSTMAVVRYPEECPMSYKVPSRIQAEVQQIRMYALRTNTRFELRTMQLKVFRDIDSGSRRPMITTPIMQNIQTA